MLTAIGSELDAPFFIRPANDSDASAVAHLLEVLGYPCTTQDAQSRLRQLREQHDQECWLVIEHEIVIAMVSLDIRFYLPLGSKTCRITALAVVPEHQTRGIGKSLLKHAEMRARQTQASRIELTTALHREAAHQFYLSCGYENTSMRFVKRLGAA
jgi:N-acetylglutamate synthase-like GNAT family acetyltransferase